MKNKQKGTINVLLSIIIVLLVVLLIYVFAQNNTTQNESTIDSTNETETVTSDISSAEPAEENTATPPNNEALTITTISESQITLSNGLVISIDDFPDDIQVSLENSFGSSDRIKEAKLSPDKKWIAIAVGGAAHDFGWLYEVSTKKLSLVAFQYGGGVSVKEWKNNTEVVFEINSPKPSTREKIVNVNNFPQYPTN